MKQDVFKLLIVEDDPRQAEVMAIVFGADPTFDLVGIARSYDESIGLLESSRVDLAVVDIDLKDEKTGIDVIRYAIGQQPDIQILVNTVHEDSGTLFNALKAGADGYVLKGLTPSQLFKALQKLALGEVPMSPKMARRMLAHFRGEQTQDTPLTPQEINILELADNGFTYQQIGEKLFISRHTVHTHLKNIYTKLQVGNRQSAISKAKKMTIL